MCDVVTLPNGTRAIVCGGHRGRKRCACGRRATLACDWRVTTRRSGTCDAPICARCTTSPAPEKDLCRLHAEAYEAWKARRADRDRAAGAGA